MLRKVVMLSLAYRQLVLALVLAVFVLGGVLVRTARVDILPEFDPVSVEVQTEALGLSAAEVEDLVTINLEEILTAAPYLQSIRSRSVPGLSSVLLTFEPGTDHMRARQMVQERLTMAWALPNVSKPPMMLQPRSAASRAMIVGLTSKDVSLIDMSVLARWTITPKLLSVPGVANVAIWGQRARQLQVQVDTHNLQAKGVTLDQIIASTGESLWVSPLSYLESSVLGASGWIDTPNQRLGIQHVQPITKASDLSGVAIANSTFTLGDVASVVEQHPPLIGDAVINGEPGIMLVVEKLPNADVNGVVEGLEKALAELSQGMSGIEVDTQIYKSTRYLDAAISNFGGALAAGAGLMVVALLLSFRAIRPTVVAATAICLSLAAALLVLHVRTSTISILDIVGLVVALVALADVAVLAVEAIIRRQTERTGGRSQADIICDALGEIRQPIIYGTLIGMLAVVPVFALPGTQEAFFGPLAQSYILALVAAVAVTFLAVPGVALLLLRKDPVAKPLVPGRAFITYQRMLPRFVASKKPVYAVLGIAILALAASLPLLTWSPVPSFIERDAIVSWEAAPGTSLQGMNRMVKGLSDSLRAVPGVRSVSGHIGRAVTGDQVVGIESGQIWLSIDDTAGYEKTMLAIKEKMKESPATEASVQSYLAGTVQRIATSKGDPVIVRIEGAEQGVLEAQALQVANAIAGVKGIGEVRIDKRSTAPEIQVKVDVAAAARFGLKPGDVRRTAATVFAGLEVGNLFEEQKVFDVVVWGTPATRQSITDIKELLIDGPGGTYVRLGDVAEVNFTSTPQVIERDGVTRKLDVHASIAGRDVARIVGEVKTKLAKLNLPFEYHAYLLNDYSEQASGNRNLALIAMAASVLVFFLMHAAVQSWRFALVLCLALLASLTGGVAAILASGGTVVLGSLAGLLAVFGMAVRGSLATVNRLQENSAPTGVQRGDPRRPEIVINAALQRFVPVVVTAAVIAAAFVPAALMAPDAGLEILQPMAVTVIGGLISAVAVTLFVIPALLLHLAVPQEVLDLGGEYYAHT